MCIMAVKDLDLLGFNDVQTKAKMKGELYNLLGRSKLLYGMENTYLKLGALKKLKTFDGNIIKRCNDLSTHSRTTALCYSMGLCPLPISLLKKRIGFIQQLTRNELTRELMEKGRCYTLEPTLYEISYEYDNIEGIINVNECLRKCKESLKNIHETEKKLKSHGLTVCCHHLLNNRNNNNDDTLQLLLDPRRVWPV